MSIFLLVFCPIGTYAYRRVSDFTNVENLHNNAVECAFKARPSNSSTVAVNSLILEDPDFTFFDSREFFLSPKSSCDEALENVKLRRVPNSTEGKRLQQERRFKVKMIKDGLNSMKKPDFSSARDFAEQMRSESTEELPAIELHMFPEKPLDVDSKWLVLLVPKARELFGAKNIYLCQPNHTEALQTSKRCVARLAFEALPHRVMNAFGLWDPLLDPLRSVPHRQIFLLELLMIFAGLIITSKTILPLVKLMLLGSDDEPSLVEQMQGPRSFKLARHVELCKNLDGEPVPEVVLEAGDEVSVVETTCTDGNISGSRLQRFLTKMKSLWRPKPRAVWGRLGNPEGWILLYDEANNWQAMLDDSKPPYRTNTQFMIPLPVLVRRQVVLAAIHASGQWILLEQLGSYLRVSTLIAVAVSFLVMNVLVLHEAMSTAKWGLLCDQMLEFQKRLRPAETKALKHFLLILGFLKVAIVLGLTSSSRAVSSSIARPCAVLVLAVALHARDLQMSLTGRKKWREIQITSEYTEYKGSKLLKADDTEPPTLNKPREQRFLAISFLTWFVAAVGLTVLMWMGLDAFQMQGTLLDYSFSRGQLVYSTGSTAIQNTLLLHDDADSVTFMFEAGAGTRTITIRVEHPQMDLKDAQKVAPLFPPPEPVRERERLPTSGEFEVNLPRGPLYGHIIVKAESKLQFDPIEYSFHVVRIGDALSLRLRGEVTLSNNSGKVPFVEERRWLFQKKHPEWYVPDLGGLCHFDIELRPVSFAPLKKTSGVVLPNLVHFSKHCYCGTETEGFGNDCMKEERIKVGSSSICLFVHSAKDDISIDKTSGSLSTSLRLVEWLRNSRVSGKDAGLRIAMPNSKGQASEPKVWQFDVTESGGSKISTVFNATLRSDSLLHSLELEVATTQDETDAEEMALPVRIVSHPPPIALAFQPDSVGQSLPGFFLPDFDVNKKRSEYFACGQKNLGQVTAQPADIRFSRMKTEVVDIGHDCFQHVVSQKRFLALRNESKDELPYSDRYLPWNENFDLAVTLSPEQCLNQAIDLDKVEALQKLRTWIHVDDKIQKTCPVVQRAARLGRLAVIKELSTQWDLNCSGCRETPLGIAAMEGNIETLNFLLDQQVAVDVADAANATALVLASRHCQVEAARLLIDRGSDVNRLMPATPGSSCWVSPLLAMFKGQKVDAESCASETKVANLLHILKEANASFYVAERKQTKERRGCAQQTALVEAIKKKKWSSVEALLEEGADANMPGRRYFDHDVVPPIRAMMKLFEEKWVPWSSFNKTVQALCRHGANVNVHDKERGSKTPLMKAAIKCKPEVVKLLIKHCKADPNAEDSGGRKAAFFTGRCEASVKKTILELLKQDVSD